MAAGASARVAEILEEAERHGRAVHEEAERVAEATRREAEGEVERILDEAREAARTAASERAQRLAELQSALARRGPALLEGLEGAGVTRARLEALIAALAASADRVLAEAEGGEVEPVPEGAAEPYTADEAEPPTEPATDEERETEPAAEGEPQPEPAAAQQPEPAPVEEPEADPPEDDPVSLAEGLAQPIAEPATPNGDAGEPARYDGSLPDGAPLARKPVRSRERDARFAALLLAVQGRERGDVAAHLRSEYGFADCRPILDEVFGPTPA